MKETLRLFVLVSMLGFWLGGLTFYAAIVVPIANRILGSGEQGLVTQEVTNWLNVIGVGVLVIVLANAWLARTPGLLIAWLILAISQVALFVIHRQLDALLASTIAEIPGSHEFHQIHERYLIAVTVQWVAGMTLVWCVLAGSIGRARQ
jgi:hypothetical protein